ncbi:caspase family protein [Streptomyces griseoloalbus]|uniref:Caspase family protein n=1 Tax=Streptomyces griseoloalbus TaxID=67303 RepID=A0ABV3E163_9ACTN
MSAGRYALLVATGHYDNQALSRLRSPARDARQLAEVLEDPRIGDFEVDMVVDGAHHEVARAIEHFFLDRRRDDLLLLHFSCHGVKDDNGELHFATTDTDRRLLASTSVPAQFVRRQMRLCRARSVVLLLDCCYSGAFLSGSKGDTAVHVKDDLAGHGRAVLTATNRTEYAWEGDRITELEPESSQFTGALIKGLRTGEADRDRDGLIGLFELYDYVYEELQDSRVKQRPQMWAELEHRVVVARSVLPTLPRGRENEEHALPEPPPALRPAPAPVPEPAPARAEPPAAARPRDPLTRLARLTELMTELACMEDAGSRLRFASVLAELLARPVDLRGVRQREDVVAIVRTALNQDGGESTLLSTIEIFEGRPTAAEVRYRLERYDGPPPHSRPAGSTADSRTQQYGTPPRGPRTQQYGTPPRGPRTQQYGTPPRSRPAGPAFGSGARPGEPAAGSDGAPRSGGRPRTALLLSLLTGALCELSCMEMPQGRAQFAVVLGEQLDRPVDLRGARLREDVVAIVRAALHVPRGERVLVEVVRILEGGPAGDDLERLIDTLG